MNDLLKKRGLELDVTDAEFNHWRRLPPERDSQGGIPEHRAPRDSVVTEVLAEALEQLGAWRTRHDKKVSEKRQLTALLFQEPAQPFPRELQETVLAKIFSRKFVVASFVSGADKLQLHEPALRKAFFEFLHKGGVWLLITVGSAECSKQRTARSLPGAVAGYLTVLAQVLADEGVSSFNPCALMRERVRFVILGSVATPPLYCNELIHFLAGASVTGGLSVELSKVWRQSFVVLSDWVLACRINDFRLDPAQVQTYRPLGVAADRHVDSFLKWFEAIRTQSEIRDFRLAGTIVDKPSLLKALESSSAPVIEEVEEILSI